MISIFVKNCRGTFRQEEFEEPYHQNTSPRATDHPLPPLRSSTPACYEQQVDLVDSYLTHPRLVLAVSKGYKGLQRPGLKQSQMTMWQQLHFPPNCRHTQPETQLSRIEELGLLKECGFKCIRDGPMLLQRVNALLKKDKSFCCDVYGKPMSGTQG
ncbi:unnamed protein product [Enterobius vermicularis]|uniref:Sterile alpha motif domain-containing protein 9-like n=1 Tax=Enterobius vermicularis TaxID=51028 RepID=A0A0N4UV23_ENTVE|nr:unnamed protein product [Enterobius vermicularis]